MRRQRKPQLMELDWWLLEIAGPTVTTDLHYRKPNRRRWLRWLPRLNTFR